jgi:hypothetical protein
MTLCVKSTQYLEMSDGSRKVFRHGEEIDRSTFPPELIPIWLDSGKLVETSRRSLFGLFGCFLSGDFASVRGQAIDDELSQYELLP